ncbi:hypothetical protein Cgig2_004266 [Carnegiea gigantea]|uniref:Uncharacterized protein n=1 Tax=Carnegiea gigantea TaxID=171969 RepID=A0A9Q1KHQ9_9CARY|nr:hypothetical protein Cgig2_004266 [Carnegiea gigantea]
MKTEQLIHCHVVQLKTNNNIGPAITEAWCILGDFNSVLYKKDRRGGTEIQDHKFGVELTEYLLIYCGIKQWSIPKQTTWPMGSQTILLYRSSSQTHQSHGQNSNFVTMDFDQIIKSVLPSSSSTSRMLQLRGYLDQLRPQLKKLNKHHYADLRTQHDIARRDLTATQQELQPDPSNNRLIQKEKEVRGKYIDILSSNISLIQQQSKTKWIKYGDDKTRLKLASYIYSLKGANGNLVEGFDQNTRRAISMDVIKQGQLSTMNSRSLCSQVVFGGCSPETQNRCLKITGLKECSFPRKYLGVPITASSLTKIEYRGLVDKILARVHT